MKCRHKWSRWYTIKSGFTYVQELGLKYGYYSIQRRRCLKCNKVEINKARVI